VVDKQHLDLIWQAALFVMSLVTLLVTKSLYSAVLLYSIGYGCLYIIYLIMSFRFSLGYSA
jgi:hypothetical protein